MIGNCTNSEEVSSSSSVFSKERTEMADSTQINDSSSGTKVGKGSSGGGKKNVGGTSKSEEAAVLLASREENKFPSDTEESTMAIDGKGKRKWGKMSKNQVTVDFGGGQSLELVDLLKSGIGKGAKRGSGGVNGGGSMNGPTLPSICAPPKFTRAPQKIVVPDLTSFRGPPPPLPVTLAGFKNTTVTRVEPPPPPVQLPPSSDETGAAVEGRKRKPRMDATLRFCRDFVLDILSKKHKNWVWPLYKPDPFVVQNNSETEEPLFLIDIKNKFNDRIYNTLQEFTLDLKKLVNYFFTNYSYDHQFYISAKKLDDMFNEEVSKVVDTTAGRKPGRGRQKKLSLGNTSTNQVNDIGATNRECGGTSNNNSARAFGGGIGMTFENLMGRPMFTNLLTSPLTSHALAIGALNINEKSPVGTGVPTQQTPPRNLEDRVSESEASSLPSQEPVGTSQPLSLSDTWSDVFNKDDDKEGETAHSPTGKRKFNEVNEVCQGKRPRIDSNVTETESGNGTDHNRGPTRLIKQEHSLEDSDVEDRRLFEQQFFPPAPAPPPRTNDNYKCKWLIDGIRGVTNQEAVIREIKNLVRADDPDFVVDLEFLENLEDRELADVGDIVRRHLFGLHPRLYQQQQSTPTGPGLAQILSAEFRTAFGLINEAIADSDRAGREIRIVQDMLFNLLTRMNALQNQNLMDLNKWHERKLALMACSPQPPVQH